ncbi:MAG: HAMP domain-containing protein [Rubrivivax sp.]|nr:HAMP domain-containing protein [Rubrivivax sp.]
MAEPRWLPRSLLGRLTLVLVVGVLMAQLAANAIWTWQLRAKVAVDTATAAQHLGHSAANSLRFFRSVPANYRPLVIQQFRDMGGTRFFVNVASTHVAVQALAPHALSDSALQIVRETIKADLPFLHDLRLAFVWPDRLSVAEGVQLADLPDNWVQHILITRPDPAPVLVIQAELEPGNWLFLASLMPNPYFLQAADPLGWDRLLLQALPLAAVLVLLIVLVLRWITRPLAALSDAAEAFGRDERVPELPQSGSREFVNTARAFAAMRQRIQKYLEDRERLFISISHDLRTPITRLKLRAEMLDDDEQRAEFEEDLDELDMMVKGALQCVKDTEIHENTEDLRLDTLLGRMARGAALAGRQVDYTPSGLTVRAKPLALKRAIGNLLDNALHYGQRAELQARLEGGEVIIEIRDHGPGVPAEALHTVFEPHVRLGHGREQNDAGLGLGLGIARSIVQAQGGQLRLDNHPQGGLVATVRLPQQATPVLP